MFSQYNNFGGSDTDGEDDQPTAYDPIGWDDEGWESPDEESASDPVDLDDEAERLAHLAAQDDTPLSEEDEPDDAWDEDDPAPHDFFDESTTWAEETTFEEERTEDEEDPTEELHLNRVVSFPLDYNDLDPNEEIQNQTPQEWLDDTDDEWALDDSEVLAENWVEPDPTAAALAEQTAWLQSLFLEATEAAPIAPLPGFGEFQGFIDDFFDGTLIFGADPDDFNLPN